MSEKVRELVAKWREQASRPRIRLSDARKDAFVAERTEGVNDALRLCADELERALAEKPEDAWITEKAAEEDGAFVAAGRIAEKPAERPADEVQSIDKGLEED